MDEQTLERLARVGAQLHTAEQKLHKATSALGHQERELARIHAIHAMALARIAELEREAALYRARAEEAQLERDRWREVAEGRTR